MTSLTVVFVKSLYSYLPLGVTGFILDLKNKNIIGIWMRAIR